MGWRRLCRGVVLGIAMTTALVEPAAARLRCTLMLPAQAAAGQAVPLRLRIANPGPTGVHLLVWGTPFEAAWFAPFVSVFRDGTELAYRGAALKRGDPERSEYLYLAPGRSRSATLDLAEAFDLTQPGRYRVEPRLVLHDVLPADAARPPRSRAQHAPQATACAAVTFELRSPPP